MWRKLHLYGSMIRLTERWGFGFHILKEQEEFEDTLLDFSMKKHDIWGSIEGVCMRFEVNLIIQSHNLKDLITKMLRLVSYNLVENEDIATILPRKYESWKK